MKSTTAFFLAFLAAVTGVLTVSFSSDASNSMLTLPAQSQAIGVLVEVAGEVVAGKCLICAARDSLVATAFCFFYLCFVLMTIISIYVFDDRTYLPYLITVKTGFLMVSFSSAASNSLLTLPALSPRHISCGWCGRGGWRGGCRWMWRYVGVDTGRHLQMVRYLLQSPSCLALSYW